MVANPQNITYTLVCWYIDKLYKRASQCIKYARRRLSLTRILPFKDRIYDSALIRILPQLRTESAIQSLSGRIWVRQNLYSRIFYAVFEQAYDKDNIPTLTDLPALPTY